MDPFNLLFDLFFRENQKKSSKSSKNLEKTKKNKKNADPNSPACTYMGLAIFYFFFLEVFLVFDQK